MDNFIYFIWSEIQTSLISAAIVVALCAGIIGYLYYRKRRAYGTNIPFPWSRILLYLFAIGYFVILSYATLGRETGGGTGEINLHFFRALREAWNTFSVKNWMNIILNIILFVPLGVFLPLIFPKLRKWYFTLLIGFLFCVYTETLQYIKGIGIFDVDDFLCNILGILMGYIFIASLLKIVHEKKFVIGIPGIIISFIPAILIVGIFIKYDKQEYGNIRQAMTYAVNTSKISWVSEFPVKDDMQQVPVYKTDTYSAEECMQFGLNMGKQIEAEFDENEIHDNEIWMTDHGMGKNMSNGAHFLKVQYPNRTFTLTSHWSNTPEWETLNESEMRSLMQQYSIHIPVNAEFTSETTGWHTFTANHTKDNDRIVDGVLQCRYAKDGKIRELISSLIYYQLYKTENIISAKEAYELLCNGKFNDEESTLDGFSGEICVKQCSLDYLVDTKGFYQPVYSFDLVVPDLESDINVVIPALAN